jgi:hypothetical protein
MPDIALQLELDTRDQAEIVRTRIQKKLGERGSVQLGPAAESLPEHHRGPGHVVTGVVLCDEPIAEAIEDIRAVLPEFTVTEQRGTGSPDARLLIALA